MTPIGVFKPTQDGFEGRLTTLSLDVAITLVPASPSDAENAPDYRILAGDGEDSHEVGAAWKRVGEKAGAFVGLVIDDPAFARPLRANLFESEPGRHVLTWSRPSRSKAKS